MGLSCLVVTTDMFFSLWNKKQRLQGHLKYGWVASVWGGDSKETLFDGPVRKYVPNACFWELLVWYGVICGRFGVILVRLECRITVSGLYVMCCLIPTLLEYLAANSGINEIWFAKAAFYLWQWSMLWWGMNRKAWTTFCVISSVSRCGKNFLYKRNQSTSYICTLPFSHKPKLSTSVFSALTAIILESWIRSLLQRSIRAFRAIAPSSYDWCFKWLEHRKLI